MLDLSHGRWTDQKDIGQLTPLPSFIDSRAFTYTPRFGPGPPTGEVIMAVPKRRVCPSRKGMRKSHQALKVPGMSLDKKTKSIHRPHHVDLSTGLYGGRQVLFREDQTGTDTSTEG